MRKIGVLIGRFQNKYLHEGHIKVYNAVAELSDDVIVLVGSAVPKLTNRNPLDYKTRELMIKSTFPNAQVAGIRDFKLNEEWSKNVDKVIDKILENIIDVGEGIPEITLYGCRDSFIPYYSGVNKTQELMYCEVPNLSATAEREKIAKEPIDSEDFRAGVIYAVGNKYPTTYPTVDVAIVELASNKHYPEKVLLGRKEFETEFRFIGGFVDPTDLTLERAALRECNEEVGTDVKIGPMKYVSSRKVNDWRYRGTNDGIMTTFFMGDYFEGQAVPSDDIFEVKWIDLKDLKDEDIVGEHIPLLNDLKEYINWRYQNLPEFEKL